MDTKEKEFIVIARCMLSSFKIYRLSKQLTKMLKPDKMNSLVGISVDARYTDKVEIMTETEFDRWNTNQE